MRTKVKGFEVYTMYVAMKAHFKTKSYDFVEFGGRIRSRISTYEKEKTNTTSKNSQENITNKRSKRFFFPTFSKTMNSGSVTH